jgi:alpha-glucosidase
MRPLWRWTEASRTRNGLSLWFEGAHRLDVRVLENNLFRVSLRKGGAWRLPRTWCVSPGSPGSIEGRERDDIGGFTCPAFDCGPLDGAFLWLATPELRVEIVAPLALRWTVPDGKPFAADRPTGAYFLRDRDHAHEHYMLRVPDEPIHGLGEKAGDLNRAGRRFEMRNLDAMGYDARSTDPLYKHVPFTLTRTEAGSWGLFYDNMASCRFDLGNELDNYHAAYRVYRAEDGDLDYYLFRAETALEVVKMQTWLTGGAAFPPRWSLGYSGSTMQYTDLPDAQARIEGFVDQAEAEGMGAESFQMSSGYTSIGPKRYVFNWNTEKFPDAPGMAARLAEKGVRLVANIKPCLLQDHPRYVEAAEQGFFVRDATGRPERSVFWDDEGSHLDFTNPDTHAWWAEQVERQLLDQGIVATWNDNNEFEIWDDEAMCHGFGTAVPAALIRPVLALLMVRASLAAQRAHAPGNRPYAITRSGGPGLQALAQTWTGDNRTDWETIRYNTRMGLGMALSGMSNTGHDVGGFAGPRPGPELFLRWVQNGALHPRFTIHSWNEDGSVTEPWMHPEVSHAIRLVMGLRRRLMPYFYTLLWRYHAELEPMIRPAFLDHEHDAAMWEESDDFLLGSDLLVASVVGDGQRVRRVRLPDHGAGWFDFATGAWFAGGQEIAMPAPLDRIPLLVRAGAILPLAEGTERVLSLWPGIEGESLGVLYEDDGETADWQANHLRLDSWMIAGPDRIDLHWRALGGYRPDWRRLSLRLPPGDCRPLHVNGRPSEGYIDIRPA